MDWQLSRTLTLPRGEEIDFPAERATNNYPRSFVPIFTTVKLGKEMNNFFLKKSILVSCSLAYSDAKKKSIPIFQLQLHPPTSKRVQSPHRSARQLWCIHRVQNCITNLSFSYWDSEKLVVHWPATQPCILTESHLLGQWEACGSLTSLLCCKPSQEIVGCLDQNDIIISLNGQNCIMVISQISQLVCCKETVVWSSLYQFVCTLHR